MFQSSLAPKDERYDGASRGFAELIGFNPRSPRRTSATTFAVAPFIIVNVSILARPEGRALLRGAQQAMSLSGFQSSLAPKDERYQRLQSIRRMTHCFNPRSPRRTSATGDTAPNGVSISVSILARPEGRALHPRPSSAQAGCIVSILARPEGRALPKILNKQ